MTKNSTEIGFKLEHWFNIGKVIPEKDVDVCEEQMLLNAFKDGLDTNSKEVKDQINLMKYSVKIYNDCFK